MSPTFSIGALLVGIGLLGAIATCSQKADAHSAAMWIQEGGYKDQDSIGCCGPTDCHLDQFEIGSVYKLTFEKVA